MNLNKLKKNNFEVFALDLKFQNADKILFFYSVIKTFFRKI